MILTDSSLVLFMAMSVLGMLSIESSALHSVNWYKWTVFTGFSMACTVSTKWTGLSVMAVVAVCTLIDMNRRGELAEKPSSEVADFVIRLVILLGIPVAVYTVLYFFFFQQLNKDGFGAAFMLPEFQATLAGNAKEGKFPEPSFWTNFFYLQGEMYRANKDITTPHSYSSYWYSWPTMQRPINCWVAFDSKNKTSSRVYLFGNPFVWWGALAGLVLSPLCLFFRRAATSKVAPATADTDKAVTDKAVTEASTADDLSDLYENPFDTQGSSVHYRLVQLYMGYFVSILPFAAVQRACFVYHYIPSLLFAMLLSAFTLDSLTARFHYALRWLLVAVLVAVYAYGFWFWAPIVYGWPLTSEEYESRVWTQTWK